MQLKKENPRGPIPAQVKLKETEKITEEAVIATLRRSIRFYSTIQAHDGHWPAESAGPMFFLPPLVSVIFHFGLVINYFENILQKKLVKLFFNCLCHFLEKQ